MQRKCATEMQRKARLQRECNEKGPGVTSEASRGRALGAGQLSGKISARVAPVTQTRTTPSLDTA